MIIWFETKAKFQQNSIYFSIFLTAPSPALFGYGLVPRTIDGAIQWSMVHIRGFQTAGTSKFFPLVIYNCIATNHFEHIDERNVKATNDLVFYYIMC